MNKVDDTLISDSGDFGAEDTEDQYQSYSELSRRDLRSLIFHILYALDAFDYQEDLSTVIDSFNRGFELDIPLDSQVATVVQAIVDERESLDEKLKPFLLNWRIERIGVCTKLILRLAMWELQQKEAAPSIIINEAIELSKCFAEKDAYKFVNGILDEAVKAMAAQEASEA